ncbi:MAG: hypothetical protein H7Z13_07820 [Ferruginibacter sp.]|nr:hypothetical protein [Ferruginibacter sp.]
MSILKRSLRYRLKGDGAFWLEPVASNEPKMFNRVDFILDHCRDKRVLHIGFTDHPFTEPRITDGSLLHLQLQQVTPNLAGMDLEATAVQQYISITNDPLVFHGDITIEYPAEVIAFNPDMILLTEVLEHLAEPSNAIEVLYKSFPAGTTVLVTVPNYTALDSLAASFNNTESIHPHHHWYFSPYTLRRLMDDKRFELNQLHFGMYYHPKKRINLVLKHYPFNGDCIIALFTIIKSGEHG